MFDDELFAYAQLQFKEQWTTNETNKQTPHTANNCQAIMNFVRKFTHMMWLFDFHYDSPSSLTNFTMSH